VRPCGASSASSPRSSIAVSWPIDPSPWPSPLDIGALSVTPGTPDPRWGTLTLRKSPPRAGRNEVQGSHPGSVRRTLANGCEPRATILTHEFSSPLPPSPCLAQSPARSLAAPSAGQLGPDHPRR
jgi:hypothetical protein